MISRLHLKTLGKSGAFLLCLAACLIMSGAVGVSAIAHGPLQNGKMTEEKALALAEEFGVEVGEVDEELRAYLGLTRAEGVVVFSIIGGSPADLAGIKVKAIIKEVDKYEIRTLLDLGRALEVSLPQQNFTVATYEPANPEDQGISAGLNFHFVRVLKD